jgi:hypothetical protein
MQHIGGGLHQRWNEPVTEAELNSRKYAGVAGLRATAETPTQGALETFTTTPQNTAVEPSAVISPKIWKSSSLYSATEDSGGTLNSGDGQANYVSPD